MGIAKRFVLSIFGMILVLAWWTIRGPGEGASSSEGIPAKVWKGGAGVVTIEDREHGRRPRLRDFREQQGDR